ncbi:MAG: hypothetical protein P8M49_00545 [Thalassotalea sp.]|nr:hypothetical protein [Thalassotalea sp.]MDG2391967.1 hypothetical protein [Thalassotalea sp.]
MTSDINKLLKSHQKLIHSEQQKVASHIQREQDEWFINTIMIDSIDVPFKYKRKKLYQSLAGQRVNMTYYLDVEKIAGFEMQVMRVVRIKVS